MAFTELSFATSYCLLKCIKERTPIVSSLAYADRRLLVNFAAAELIETAIVETVIVEINFERLVEVNFLH